MTEPWKPKLLNIRKMFIPDPGHTIIDCDIAGADAMVFAWEVGEGAYMDMLRAGTKIHVVSNRYMFPNLCGENGRAEPYYTNVKSAFHGTNYGAGYRTLAANLSWPEVVAQKFITWHFSRFPEIKAYHRKVETQLMTTRTITNKFGYRIYFFDDVRTLLPEALAWLPQSTVAIVSFKAALKVRSQFPPEILRILLQVHDSLVYQCPTPLLPQILPALRATLNSISVPYPNPLILPWNFKISDRSWGDIHPVDWSLYDKAA